jgi:hypothetical protein
MLRVFPHRSLRELQPFLGRIASMKGLLVVLVITAGAFWDLMSNNGAWIRQLSSLSWRLLRATGLV